MNEASPVQPDDRWILAQRPSKNSVNAWQPYAYLAEKERMQNGVVENVATIFLTNRECPFRCLMCDLWKNTTEHRVPEGAIPTQIQYALEQLPPASQIKLYNSGNFFDDQAIPPVDIPEIAKLIESFESVIVECHPRLVSNRCLAFRDLLRSELQIAMGLETVHPDVLKKLNKRMTLKDFEHAANFLINNDLSVRAFILLGAPYLNEAESVIWARRSIDFAFDVGVECCVIIPTRSGNGAIERLHKLGLYGPPKIASLEEVLEYGIQLQQGRVFADLWDVEKFANCNQCSAQRIHRMGQMNFTQMIASVIHCNFCF